MFEWELIDIYEWWKIYECPDKIYRAIEWKAVLEWNSVEWLKYRITEMENRKPYTREQKRNHKWVYMK